ncbi:MAG: lactate utilization protein [Clostridiales bacterium]|nr:lactate utilization protein [Clostridiales bacterium]
MDTNTNFIIEKRLHRTADNLKRNNINAYVINNLEELHKVIKSLISPNDIVALGGSMTLFETGVIDLLRDGDYQLLDRYEKGLAPEDIRRIFLDSFDADAYFTSTNALTTDGMLYNIDGTGNRVAAMLYGPKKVIVVVGINKIVNNLEEAENRLKNFTAPSNAKRLNLSTPCASTGICSDCNSPDRICTDYVTIKRQRTPNRMHVLLLKDEYGY